MKQMEKVVRVGDKDTKIFLVAWHDNKPVHVLSSIPSVKSECNRVVRNQDGSWDPNRKVDRPWVIKIYNAGMGGTDGFDQCLSYYRPKVIAIHSWYPKVFIHTIAACAANGFVVYKEFHGLLPTYTFLDFLRALIGELAKDELAKRIVPLAAVSTEPKKRKYVKDWENDTTGLTGYHLPLVVKKVRMETKNKEAETKSKRNYKRGDCMVCERKVSMQCMQCKIYLCIEEYEGCDKSCWDMFHRVEKFTQYK